MRGTIKKVLAIENYSENPFSQHQSKPVGYLLFRKKIPLTFSKIDKFVFRKKNMKHLNPFMPKMTILATYFHKHLNKEKKIKLFYFHFQ